MLQPLGHLFHPLILTVLLVAPIGVLSNKGLVPLLGIMGAWALFNAARDGQMREVFSGFLPLWVFWIQYRWHPDGTVGDKWRRCRRHGVEDRGIVRYRFSAATRCQGRTDEDDRTGK